MSRPHHQSKLSNPSLLSMQEKLSFYNLLLTSPNKPSKFPNLKPIDISPSSLTSRNITNSIYEKKSSKSRNNDYDIIPFQPQELKFTTSNKKPIFTATYSEFLNASDLKKSFRTPKITKSISKMEEIFNKNEQELEKEEFQRKLKEKYLKSLGFKKEIGDLDFNDKEIKGNISHCYAISLILLEKTLNKCIIFEEEELFFNNIIELIQHFIMIMSSFQRIYNTINEENRNSLRKIETLTENVKTMIIEKGRNLSKQDEFSTYKNLMKSPLNENNFKSQLDFIQNKFNLEKIKLINENDHLRLLMRKTENDEKIDSLEQELKSSTEQSAKILRDLRRENALFINKINNIEFASNNQKTMIRSLEQDLKVLTENMSKNEKNYLVLRVSSDENLEKIRVFREIALMAHEEILSVKQGFLDKTDIINKVKENYFSIQNKLVYMTNMQQLPKIQDFLQNFDLLSEITTYFNQNPRIFLKNALKITEKTEDFQKKNQDNSLETSTLDIKTVDSIHSIELAKFRYYKPSFFSLIETRYKQFELNGQKANKSADTLSNNMNFELQPHFISILRGIMDSKWNEFVYYENTRYYSSFPEFVYSWLGKFEINLETRTVTSSNNQDPDEDRCQFLKSLVHPVIDKHWESVTFREFLEERSSSDEVFFYLYSRFLLFKGPQLNHSQGKFCFVHFVNYERISEVIENLFRTFEEETVNFLKKKLKAKAKIKNNIVFIDSGFVLRIFLEYYRLERKHRFRLLQELFLVKAQNKLYIKFEEFKQIMEAFQINISDLEKAFLYREAFNVSQGKIDAEVLFLVLSENNFFIKTIKTRLMNTPQTRKSLAFQNESDNSYISDPNNQKIMNDFLNLEPKILDISIIAGSLGLEGLHFEIQNQLKMFKKQGNLENWEFNGGKSLLYTYFKFHETLMRVRNFEIFMKTSEKTIKEEEILKTELFFFENVYNCIYKIKNQQIVREMEENANARKIQKWVQVRFSRWLKLLYTVFKVKIHQKKMNNSVHSGNTAAISNKSFLKEKKNQGN